MQVYWQLSDIYMYLTMLYTSSLFVSTEFNLVHLAVFSRS